MSGATNKITALYCRLSQEDARLGESLSIENQKAILLEYAKKNHFPNPVFFVDDGYSGTNYDRPGFQSMLTEIEAGHIGIVITKDLSRLGRNSALTGLYTHFTFPQYGVRYIAINDNYDTIDPNSVNNDFAGIKNWFNEFYARDTSRKIRAVQKAKGERGVPLTVNVPYGYVKDPENPKHWLVDPEAAAIVKRIFSMCMEGRGPTQIANQLWVDKVLTPTAYKLFYPQLGVKLCSMAGGGVQKIYMVFLREPSLRDRSGSDLFHLWDGFEIKMNFDRNVSCFIFVNALMHDDFFD